MLGCVRDVIVAANDVGDPHLDIVGHDREVVGGMAVRSQDDEVFDVRAIELDRAVHQIVEPGHTFRHAEPDRAGNAIALASGDDVGRQPAAHAIVSPGLALFLREIALPFNSSGVQ